MILRPAANGAIKLRLDASVRIGKGSRARDGLRLEWLGRAAHQSVLKAAKMEASRVVSLPFFLRSPCILPAALKTRSTAADDAGAAKYCLTILARKVGLGLIVGC